MPSKVASSSLHDLRTCSVLHQPHGLASRSGLFPMAEALGGFVVRYDIAWSRLQRRSWTAGAWLRRAGNSYYGSEWNALVPLYHDLSLPRRVFAAVPSPDIVHFLWGEFCSPRWPGLFRRRGARLVGTFHCSARRQHSVLAARRDFHELDWITVMSATQVPFFVERGFPADRISVILHGVDTEFYCPDERALPRAPEAPLRGILVGKTERDHEFMARLLRLLPPGVLTMDVYTDRQHHALYAGLPQVRLSEFVTDEQLRDAYRSADLLVIPLLDCTANNAVLEAMACGTPVMTNRVGGIGEYLDPSLGFLLEDKDPDRWVTALRELARDPSPLARLRAPVRQRAEAFNWRNIVPSYFEAYRKCREAGQAG